VQTSFVEAFAMLHSRWVPAVAITFLALALSLPHAWAFDEHQLLDPVQRENLTIYFVRGGGSGGRAPLKLDQAINQGDARMSWQQKGPVAIENLSDQTIYVPFGTLLKGGLQDQVVSQDVLLRPRSGRIFLPVFCVDPFRSTQRLGEDAAAFQPTGKLFPWLNARLSMLAGSESSKAEQIRQMGIWWSVDTLRSQLSAKIGIPLEPPPAASSAISDKGVLPTSLVLALENEKLAQALAPYLVVQSAPEANHGNIIGAVFAINGRILAADVYQSNRLFLAMWPDLFRAYSTEAVALSNAKATASPNTSTVRDFLSRAQQNEEHSKRKERAFNIRENAATISTEIRDAEIWIHRSYISKLGQSSIVNTPDALAVSILESGSIDNRSIESLGYDESVLLRNDNREHLWRAVVVRNSAETAFRLNTSRLPILNLRDIFSAEMLSTENDGRSAGGHASRTKSNQPTKYVMVALTAATGLFAALLNVLLGHTRRSILIFIRKRSSNLIGIVADSSRVFVRSTFGFFIYSQRLFSRIRFKQFLLFEPTLPWQNELQLWHSLRSL